MFWVLDDTCHIFTKFIIVCPCCCCRCCVLANWKPKITLGNWTLFIVRMFACLHLCESVFELPRTSEHSLYSFIPFLNLDYFDVPVLLTRKPIWYWIFCAQRLTIIATFSITMTLFQWLAFVMKKENKDPNKNGRGKVEKSKTWMKANLMRRWKANRKIIMTRWWSVCRVWSSFDEKRYHLQRT